MASVSRSLVMVLSGLLVASGYSFPGLRLHLQDGVAGDDNETHNLRADSLLVATGQWEWKEAGETRHGAPLLPRRKRAITAPVSNTTAMETTTVLLVEDETTEPVMGLTTHLMEGASHPGLARNGSSAEAPARTASPLNGSSTEGPVTHRSPVVDTTPFHGQMPSTSLVEDSTEPASTEDSGRLSHTADAARPTSAASPRVFEAISTISGGTVGLSTRSVGKTGNTSSPLAPPLANPRPTPTDQLRPLPKTPVGDPDKRLWECLLAISLLALVAGIFIITTFVLATLLWRQRRAYKLNQRNHTEMVCISSLLAAEEAEASGGRHPRAKRVKLLAEDGSETDMDNLTLNSFLPEH